MEPIAGDGASGSPALSDSEAGEYMGLDVQLEGKESFKCSPQIERDKSSKWECAR